MELGPAINLDVLELGCGTGLAAIHLRSRARLLFGLDLSREMVAHAKRRGLYDLLEVAEITEWLNRAAASPFDLIAAADTLIYFGDLRQVLIPAAKHLRVGGWIAFTVEHEKTSLYRLTDSGRYAHSKTHILDAASAAGLAVKQLWEGLLRYEYGEAVIGLVVVLQRTAAISAATNT